MTLSTMIFIGNVTALVVLILLLRKMKPVAKEYPKDTIPDDPYKMCTPQDAQIDCRMRACVFQKEGSCLRQGGPAITLNPESSAVCWTFRPRLDITHEEIVRQREKNIFSKGDFHSQYPLSVEEVLNQGDGRPVESLKSSFEKIAFSDRKAADESWKDNLSASALMEVEKGEKDLQKHLEKIDLMCRKEETLNEVMLKGKKPTHKDKQSDHNSYGLRNWLSQKGFCAGDNNSFDNAEYKELVTAFCESNGFDHSKSVGFKSMETFCQNRFGLFKKFSFAYFSKKP